MRAAQAGHGLMLSRTQPRPSGQPTLPLDAIQNPIIDAYLAALPPGVEPRILASRTAFVADSQQYAQHVAASLGRDSVLRRVTDISFQVHSVEPSHRDTLRSIELIAQHIAPQIR